MPVPAIIVTGAAGGIRPALPLTEGVPDAVIVNMASVAGCIASTEHRGHVAARPGIEGLTKGLAAMPPPRGIRVHALASGWVDAGLAHAATAALDRAGAADLLKGAAAQHLLGRIAQPDEIAKAAAWLVCPRARHLAGTTRFVDGGLMRVH